jgi:hypothetical protein
VDAGSSSPSEVYWAKRAAVVGFLEATIY